MNKKKVEELVKEIKEKEALLIKEKGDLLSKNEAMEKDIQKVQGPIQTVQNHITEIQSVIVATGEIDPSDLTVAKGRLEKLENIREVAINTISKNTKRIAEIEKDLADNERNRRALTVFSNTRELNDIALTGLFKPLTKAQEKRLRELYKWNEKMMNMGSHPEQYLYTRAIKDLIRGKPYIKLY